MPILLVLAAAVLLVEAAPAGAVAVAGGGGPALRSPRAGTNLTLASPVTGTGMAVNGFSANTSFQPVVCVPPNSTTNCTAQYPGSNPSTGAGSPWSVHNVSFAGTLRAHPVPNPDNITIFLYCIDIHTTTRAGINYELGSWEASGMPNVGYVARILNLYYPNVPGEPSGPGIGNGAGGDPTRAAAVQAAIWFFTDNFVVSTSGGQTNLRNAVRDIVNRVVALGPLVTPDPPSLAITPSSLSGSAVAHGPFRITSNHPPVTVTATGGTMHSSATDATPLPNPQTVNSGDFQRWLRLSPGNTTRIVTLTATSTARVPSGNVYLFNETCTTPTCPADAQRLILAAPATLTTTVRATAEFVPFGKLIVKKTIDGPAAGHRGQVVIQVRCDDGVRRDDFVIPPGSSVRERVYDDIPAGTMCTVTETSSGAVVGSVIANVTGDDGREVTIPAGGAKTVHITDTYDFEPGALTVRKIIGGEAEGMQGEIVIRTVCDGRHLTPDFVIPPHAAPGLHTNPVTYKVLIPDTGTATCTVTQTVDGHTTTVSPPVTVGSGQTVHFGPGQSKSAVITDDYGNAPGSLEVTKFITGSEAGQQGEIVIQAVCNGVHQEPDFTILPGTFGPVETHTFLNIPTPASCVVTETSDGSSSTVSVDVTGSPTTVNIAPGGSGAAEITDTYGAVPGSLLVSKTIAGPSAGHQGPVTIQVVCDGVALPEFVIPAHTPAGTVSQTFGDIPAGSMCTVTEMANGATSTVIADVLGNDQTVTIPAGDVESVSLTDVYDEGSPQEDIPEEPGSPAVDATGILTVTKHITGPAAHDHGRIAILVACGGTLENFTFIIPAGTGPGVYIHHFDELPPGSVCHVIETENGRTGTVGVAASGSGRTVTIPASGSASVSLTDRFTAAVKASFTG